MTVDSLAVKEQALAWRRWATGEQKKPPHQLLGFTSDVLALVERLEQAGHEKRLNATIIDGYARRVGELEERLEQAGRENTRLVMHEEAARNSLDDARGYIEVLKGTLERIAAGKRPDGTYNLSREACEQIARAALAIPREEPSE